MPDILIRNLPVVLHVRLKAAAASHRRSVTQEAIAIIDEKLGAGLASSMPPQLPAPVQLRSPTSMEESLQFIDGGLDDRGLSHDL